MTALDRPLADHLAADLRAGEEMHGRSSVLRATRLAENRADLVGIAI